VLCQLGADIPYRDEVARWLPGFTEQPAPKPKAKGATTGTD
jgi:hypothetical protein